MNSNSADGEKGKWNKSFIELRLKLVQAPLTAHGFLEIWKRYDQDASRFLEAHELRRFLHDLMTTDKDGKKTLLPEAELTGLVSDFMREFDENKDGKISIKELMSALPLDECFCTIFHQENSMGNGVDYMKTWKKYDKDLSGYIEGNELKEFLRDIVTGSDRTNLVNEKRLNEYTKTVMILFDSDGDGRLALAEMARLLPEQENFVHLALKKAQQLQSLKQTDINKILDCYDKDKSGFLEGYELSNLVLDLLEFNHPEGQYTAHDLFEVEKALLKGCDVNGDGKIDRKELAIILMAISNSGLSGLFSKAENFVKVVVPDRKVGKP